MNDLEKSIIFQTTDPLGRNIIIKKETLEHKIFNYYHTNDNREHGNSHPEMEKRLDDIKESLTNPDLILPNLVSIINDNGEKIWYNNNRQQYIKQVWEKKDDVYLPYCVKSIVEFADNSYGDLVTSHLVKKQKDLKVLNPNDIVYRVGSNMKGDKSNNE